MIGITYHKCDIFGEIFKKKILKYIWPNKYIYAKAKIFFKMFKSETK